MPLPPSALSLRTPLGPRHVPCAWLGHWPLRDGLLLPVVSRGVRLVAPACSILSAHTSTWSTRKSMWCRARHAALCAPTSGSSRCVLARMVKRRLPGLRGKWGPPPNRCHPEYVFGKGRILGQVMGGQGERRDVRPCARSPQDVPVLGCDGTARQHT